MPKINLDFYIFDLSSFFWKKIDGTSGTRKNLIDDIFIRKTSFFEFENRLIYFDKFSLCLIDVNKNKIVQVKELGSRYQCATKINEKCFSFFPDNFNTKNYILVYSLKN
jgi:hypothetical protein